MTRFSDWVTIRENKFGPDAARLYQDARNIVGMKWGGPISPDMIMTSTFLASAGLDVSKLLEAGVIVPHRGGNYIFNPTLDQGMRRAFPALDVKPQPVSMPPSPPPPPFLRNK